MIPILAAMNLSDPLMLMFGVLAAAAGGAATGYVAGTSIGRTRPATPLPTTIKVTRDQLAATCAQLDQASSKLNAAQRSDLAGHTLVMGRRISELATALGRVGHKAKQEGSS
jgi:hypothetical protein